MNSGSDCVLARGGGGGVPLEVKRYITFVNSNTIFIYLSCCWALNSHNQLFFLELNTEQLWIRKYLSLSFLENSVDTLQLNQLRVPITQ